MGTPRDSSSNHHSPRGGSGSSGEAVNSPQSRRWNNLSSPWARVVQGQAESTSPVQHSPSPPRSPSISSAAPEQSSFSEKVMSSSSSPPPPVDNADGAGVNNNASLAKKPAWNMPSNGILENEPVMGAESWPALSESARASPKSSSVEALWKSAADGSVTGSEGPVIPHSPQKQTASSAKSNSAPNHTMAARQRSMKHGSGVGGSSMSGGGPPQSTFAHPPVPPPPPPHPFPLPSHTMPAAPDQSPMEQYYRGNSWEMRPIGGFVPQPRVVNDHRNYSRRGNFGPRGDGPLHNNYGGRRQDRGNYMNAGDVHVQSQRGQARPLVRPPTSPPPFLPPQNIRPFPNHVGDVVYFPTMPVEPFRGMGPYVPHGSYHAMYMPVLDPPLPFKLVTQIDYYFSDVNLEGDDFLKSNMDDQGWVPISLIASFPRVKNLTNNLQFILDSLRGSAIVEVQDDKLRRRNNWMKYVTNSSRFVTGSTSPPATGPNQDMVATSLEKLNLSQEASDRNEPGKSTPHSEDAAGRHLPGLTGRPSSPMGRLLKT